MAGPRSGHDVELALHASSLPAEKQRSEWRVIRRKTADA
jgi:hypothetical protein